MNGNLMYEMATQRLAEQRRSAQEAGEAQRQRAAARGRRGRGRGRAEAETAVPAIPDFAHEMFAVAARDAVPAPRPETARGRHARTGR